MIRTEASPVGAQLALWFKDRLPKPGNLLSEVDRLMPGVFDGAQTVLPLPPDNAGFDEAPAAMLESSHGIRLTIGRKRADLFVSANTQAKEPIEALLESVSGLGHSFFDLLAAQSIVRVGLVLRFRYAVPQAASAVERLLVKQASDLQTGTTYDVGVVYVTRHLIVSREFNDRTEVGRYQDSGEVAGVQVTRDFNSVPEDSTVFFWQDVEMLVEQSKTLVALERIEALMWTNL